MKKTERDKLYYPTAPVVRLSPAERFLNWYAKHTKLYIRGQQGKDWAEQRRLDQELFDVLNPWLCSLIDEARREERAENRQLFRKVLEACRPHTADEPWQSYLGRLLARLDQELSDRGGHAG